MNVSASRLAPLLWLLTLLFVARVAGQMLVAFFGVRWLPPMEAWMSGLMPYVWLLPSQFAIIALLVKVSADFARGEGFFVRPRAVFARGAFVFGWVYLGAMIVRGLVFGLSIPVVFHWVLAAFVILFAAWHRSHPAGVR